jgi:hypothetical protein
MEALVGLNTLQLRLSECLELEFRDRELHLSLRTLFL